MLTFHRLLIVYIVAIPLALLLGYMVATPDVASIATVGMVLFFLALPLLIRWNHWLLIFFWNAAFIANFLPGALPFWVIFACLTFGMGVVNHVMGHKTFLRAPELTKPILFLLAVVLLTGKIRGGIGMQILGSGTYGGKNYFFILAAIMGYFALISQPISMLKSARAVNWFFLSALTSGLSNLVYILGPAFYFLYYLTPVGAAVGQAAADYDPEIVKRFGGLGPVGSGLLCFILARWGLRGTFELDKPWRLLLLATALAAGLFSGFRSQVLILLVLLAFQFIIEGLWRTPLLPVFVGVGILCVAPMLFFANKMPYAVQRSMAFLPVDIDSSVRTETEASTDWRLEMWREVLPEVSQYLLIGKGYALSPTDLYLTEWGVSMGFLSSYAGAITSGDYHSGPLSVLMPFGIWGAIAFIWLLGAGLKVLHSNRQHGEPRLKRVNDFLFVYFLTQSLFFIFVFGALNSQLPVFLGVLGLSISLNGGVRRKEAAKTVPVAIVSTMALEPA